jgi:hypothetical protein
VFYVSRADARAPTQRGMILIVRSLIGLKIKNSDCHVVTNLFF